MHVTHLTYVFVSLIYEKEKRNERDKVIPTTICRFGIHNQFQMDDGANEGSIHFHHNFHQIQQWNCNLNRLKNYYQNPTASRLFIYLYIKVVISSGH